MDLNKSETSEIKYLPEPERQTFSTQSEAKHLSLTFAAQTLEKQLNFKLHIYIFSMSLPYFNFNCRRISAVMGEEALQ